MKYNNENIAYISLKLFLGKDNNKTVGFTEARAMKSWMGYGDLTTLSLAVSHSF